ncbi:MAG: heparinase II/III family protein [Verrucomicrobiales bacterium]|nr:heparinase II/III family protein [Verrucomicrobiales bacterium]
MRASGFLGTSAALLAAMAMAGTVPAIGSMVPLAEAFPPDKIAEVLVDGRDFHPFPNAESRTEWTNLSTPIQIRVVKNGEKVLTEPNPPLPATLYLGYAREGNRGRFEGPYFERRRRLHDLVLAECVEAKGRFVDAIADHLWAILEESTWCVPAHVGAQRRGVGLPDVAEPIVDLFAAQTGASVAWTVHLVGSALDRVSPRIRERALSEVDRRIITSYLSRDYGWMGFGAKSRADRPNNWNPWINGNVLTAALLLEPDKHRRVALVHRVLRSLDRFLQPYPEDGGCDEGPSYWSRAGGSVFDNLDLLFSATGGRLDVFGEPLIQEMGRFIHRVHIADGWFVDIGDSPARVGIDRGVIYAYGRRIRDAQLEAFATQGATLENVLGTSAGIDLGRALRTLFSAEAILAGAKASPPLVRDVWLHSEDLQMMVARDRNGSTEGLFVAAWGGHNAQSHNHNDVGNVMVFADGNPVFVDLGAPTYTAKTFSSRRYEIPAMQSDWHNLPTIHGLQQSAGRSFAARDVSYTVTDRFAELNMDLASAWPEDAGVTAWKRTVRLERESKIVVSDRFRLRTPATHTWLNLITPTTPQITQPGRLEMPLPSNGAAASRTVILGFDPGKLAARIESFDVTDQRLAEMWGPRMQRIQLELRDPQSVDGWVVEIGLQPRTR